jgi:hypothetical protein
MRFLVSRRAEHDGSSQSAIRERRRSGKGATRTGALQAFYLAARRAGVKIKWSKSEPRLTR